MKQFDSHFNMVVSTVIAIVLSLLMSTFVFFLDRIPWTVQDALKSWGSSYLIITLTGWIFPLNTWSQKLSDMFHFKRSSVKAALTANTVNSLFFNFFTTVIMTAVNMYGNPSIEAAVSAGAAPSVTSMVISSVIHDLPLTFVFSFICAWLITKPALKIARRACEENFKQLSLYHN